MGPGYGDRLARGGTRAVFGAAGSRMTKEAWDAMFEPADEQAPTEPIIDRGEVAESVQPTAKSPISAARLEVLLERFNHGKG